MEYLEGMGRLKSLDMAGNKIEKIPDDIIKLLNLEQLDLSTNKLTLYVSPCYVACIDLNNYNIFIL